MEAIDGFTAFIVIMIILWLSYIVVNEVQEAADQCISEYGDNCTALTGQPVITSGPLCDRHPNYTGWVAVRNLALEALGSGPTEKELGEFNGTISDAWLLNCSGGSNSSWIVGVGE